MAPVLLKNVLWQQLRSGAIKHMSNKSCLYIEVQSFPLLKAAAISIISACPLNWNVSSSGHAILA